MAWEEEIGGVQDYLRIIKNYKEKSLDGGNLEDFLFRGQQNDLPLIPKIARLAPKGDILATEKLILSEFKRTNPLLIDIHNPLDDWDYLTLGQHFGLPTRLLDWSHNALTALWFATSGGNYNQTSCSSYSLVWILMADASDHDLDIKVVHPFEIKETKIFRPRIIKQRINNQSGVFSIQSNSEIKAKSSLDSSEAFENKLLKVKIPANTIPEIREDLNTLGVNAFTIFPELEGLCSHLQWLYFT